MDLLGDLGTDDQLTSARAENVVLHQKVKELTVRVKALSIENESLKAEVEIYRKEVAVPTFSKLALGQEMEGVEEATGGGDDFVRAGNGIYPKKNEVSAPKMHGVSNISACALSPDDVVLATGGADSTLRLLPWGAAEGAMDVESVVKQAASVQCSAPVISVAFSPVLRNVLAVGCMDGSVGLVYYQSSGGSNSITLATSFVPLEKKHVKYVRKVAWSPNQNIFVSTSADGCIYMYKVEKKADLMEDDDTPKLEVTLVESFHLTGAVEACCFSEDKLICYVRGTPHLTFFDLSNDMKQTLINFNQQEGTAAGGFSDHVSFAILDLRPYKNQYLAAATDASRNIILDLKTGKVLKNLYGHSNDGFSQPKVCWSQSGQYLLGNTQDASVVCVWDIASQQIVQRLEGHSSPIRDMCAGNTMDILVTTAFDKRTSLWFAE
mmetsp:Transcript_19808/g.25500  ORF Transcript_19808/g.25500 Transcript_19808/m.25500 type:complete len:436 (-) Transcript_19808:107-1414(-)